jgi:hypothetical protein
MHWLTYRPVAGTALLLIAFLVYSTDFILNTNNVYLPILLPLQYTYATNENEEQEDEADEGERGGGNESEDDDADNNNNNNLEEIIEKSFVERTASPNNTLTLVSYTLTRNPILDDPILEINGEIRNDGAIAQEFVRINATFYDEEDEIVGTDYAYADTDILELCQVAPFDLSVGFEDGVPVDDINYIQFYLDSQEADESGVDDDNNGNVEGGSAASETGSPGC